MNSGLWHVGMQRRHLHASRVKNTKFTGRSDAVAWDVPVAANRTTQAAQPQRHRMRSPPYLTVKETFSEGSAVILATDFARVQSVQ